MRAVVQRVSTASVTVDGEVVGQIGRGLLVLLGVQAGDAEADLTYIVNKVAELRIFPDDAVHLRQGDGGRDRMNVDVRDAGGAVLVVSQFTLLGDSRKGRRPSWSDAAQPAEARAWYERAVDEWRARGLDVQTGVFQAQMQVALVNDGPVTLLLDSRRVF